jgi:hypothetical protein
MNSILLKANLSRFVLFRISPVNQMINAKFIYEISFTMKLKKTIFQYFIESLKINPFILAKSHRHPKAWLQMVYITSEISIMGKLSFKINFAQDFS